MKTLFNNNNNAKKIIILQQQTFHVYPALISFVVAEKKFMKIDNNDKSKLNHKKINMLLDYTNENKNSTE